MVPHDKDKDNPSELIRGKDITAFGLWSLPNFGKSRDESVVATPQVPAATEPAPVPPAVEEVKLETARPPTLEEIGAVRQDAYNEGFVTDGRDGSHAGQLKTRQEAKEALKERLQSLERLMAQLPEPIAEQDALIEQGMVNLVDHIAHQVIQRELHMNSSHVCQVLREALKLPPMGAANIRIHVNPQDFERVKALCERHKEGQWVLRDGSLLPGSCRIEAEHSRIDTTIETHLAQAVKQLFKQQREQTTHPLASDIRTDLDVPGDVDAS